MCEMPLQQFIPHNTPRRIRPGFALSRQSVALLQKPIGHFQI